MPPGSLSRSGSPWWLFLEGPPWVLWEVPLPLLAEPPPEGDDFSGEELASRAGNQREYFAETGRQQM